MVWTSIACLGLDSSVSGSQANSVPWPLWMDRNFSWRTTDFRHSSLWKTLEKHLFLVHKNSKSRSSNVFRSCTGNRPSIHWTRLFGRNSCVSKSARDLNVTSLPELRLMIHEMFEYCSDPFAQVSSLRCQNSTLTWKGKPTSVSSMLQKFASSGLVSIWGMIANVPLDLPKYLIILSFGKHYPPHW